MSRVKESKSSGIVAWPEGERPRERLLRLGVQSLTDAELVGILLRVGVQGTNAVELARLILKKFGSLRALAEVPLSALLEVKGLKGAKAAQLAAAMEVARRVSLPDARKRITLKSTRAAADYLRSRLQGLSEEHFRALFLNRRGALLEDALLAAGAVDHARPPIRLIMARALQANSSAVIVAHNHPSGAAEASESPANHQTVLWYKRSADFVFNKPREDYKPEYIERFSNPSKLLIAQVLGRGLRRPDGWQGADPIVTVFNHDAWANRIRPLVDEILEMENRLSSSITEGSPYHFDLHNLDYTRETDTSQFTKKGEYRLLEEGFVDLPSQVEVEDVAIDFEQAVTGDHTKFKTRLEHKTYSFEDVAEEMYRRLQSIDVESKDAPDPKDRTQYAQKFPLGRCLEIVKASARRARIRTGKITEENRQKILQALGPLRRKSAKRVVYKLTPNALRTFRTKERPAISVGAAELRRGDKTVFYTPDCEKTIPDEQRDFFNAVRDPDGDYLAGREAVANSHDFKTPCNMAIADWTPERKFIRLLCERDNAQALDGWLKNSPQRFHSIEYAWKKGEHPKRADFSPDFFIRKGKTIYVVEIKDDGEIDDPLPENQKKFEYARDHFERLNDWLKKAGIDVTYQLNFLTPKSFNRFFIQLRKDDARGFRSELDVVLGQLKETNGQGN